MSRVPLKGLIRISLIYKKQIDCAIAIGIKGFRRVEILSDKIMALL